MRSEGSDIPELIARCVAFCFALAMHKFCHVLSKHDKKKSKQKRNESNFDNF